MPATDYLMPGGLEWEELGRAAAAALRLAGGGGAEHRLPEPGEGSGGTLTRRAVDLLVAVLGA